MKAVHIFLFATILGAVSAEGTRAQTDLETAVSHLQFREIGPALMGGRIADLAGIHSARRNIATIVHALVHRFPLHEGSGGT